LCRDLDRLGVCESCQVHKILLQALLVPAIGQEGRSAQRNEEVPRKHPEMYILSPGFRSCRSRRSRSERVVKEESRDIRK
jgi:hypothetical protein